jgi:hypothetical protein
MSERPYPRVRYTGELARPIRLRDYENPDAAAEVIENRLKTLASVHKVNLNSPNASSDLAVALMQAHVPGLRITSGQGRGRKRTWLDGLGEALRIEINDIREQFKITVSEAIARLRGDKSKPWSDHRPQTLAARYRDASRRYRTASQRDRIALALMAREAAANRD